MKIYVAEIDIKEADNYLNPIIKEVLDKKIILMDGFIQVDQLEDADFIVVSHASDLIFDLNKEGELVKFIKLAQAKDKKIIVFTSGDIGLTVCGEHIIMLRLGGFASKMNQNDLVMPPFIEDPIAKHYDGVLYKLEKTEKPTIGFVGHSNGSTIKYFKEYLLFLRLNLFQLFKMKHIDFQAFYPSSVKRHFYLNQLMKVKTFSTNFIFRAKYRAGVKNEVDKKKTTLEFFNNINENLYTFCMRGGGNFSVRLYETLSLGKIPILLDTDCKLPFEKTIDWSKHCVIIKESEFHNIEKCILDFHNKLDDEKMKELQELNRKLWVEYFFKPNYMLQLSNELDKLK
jgi:hypothetical protein